MTILGIVRAVLGLLSGIVGWAGDRQLIEAGEAKAIARGLEVYNERLAKAITARRAVKHDADSVRDDPFNRDR